MGCTSASDNGPVNSVETMPNYCNLESELLNDDGLSSMIELHMSVSNLKIKYFNGSSYPLIVISTCTQKSEYTEVGKTEKSNEKSNPCFVKSVIMKHIFEEKQKIKFDIHSIKGDGNEVSANNYIGSCIMEPHEIIRAPHQEFRRKIVNSNEETIGELIVNGESLSKKMSANVIYIEFEGHIKKKGSFFVKIYRSRQIDSQDYLPVFQTESHESSPNQIITWEKIRIGAASLIKDDLNSVFKIEILQYQRYKQHRIVGEKLINFKQFMENKPSIYFTNDTNNFIKPKCVLFEERYSFIEYLFNGLNIAMMIVIDFTASNGNPTNIDSLHSIEQSKNQYLSAINSVGSILEYYDTDKMIPIFGYGARIQQLAGITSHCFSLNGNIFNPEVPGINGVTETYRSNIMKLQFSGPTHFSPSINYIRSLVEIYVNQKIMNIFFVVMIITDGVIHDMDDTIDEIVLCSKLPMAFIIVGVGEEDFTHMKTLDGNDVPLTSKRYGVTKSDIVRFVELKKYINNPQELATETLKELPRQVSDYMKSQNANPRAISASGNPTFNVFEYKKQQYLNIVRHKGFNVSNINRAVQIGEPSMEDEFMREFSNRPQYFNPLINGQGN